MICNRVEMLVRCQECARRIDVVGAGPLVESLHDFSMTFGVKAGVEQDRLERCRDDTVKGKEQAMRSLIKLLNVVVNESGHDVPICSKCLFGMEAEIHVAINAQQDVKRVLQDEHRILTTEAISHRQQANGKSQMDLEMLMQRLEQQRKDTVDVEVQMEALFHDEAELVSLHDEFWREVSTLEKDARTQFQASAQLQRSIMSHSLVLSQLRKTSFLDDCFSIRHEGHFGTINGFRLGRLQSVVVEWNEINAALGEVVLLLDILANRLGCDLDEFRLVPAGGSSSIVNRKDKSVHPLYTQKRSFFNRSLDNGLVVLLTCTKRVADHLETQKDKSLFEHDMTADAIAGCSVRINFNQEENWTKAMKYLLINLKTMIYHSCGNVP